MTNRRVLVTGAGGFIGHHLITRLKKQGCWVRGVDWHTPLFPSHAADEFLMLDLRDSGNCLRATEDIQDMYALAADMGGMGFIAHNHARILYNNSLINIHSIDAARQQKVERVFFASSACVYPEFLQTSVTAKALRESDAYPAQPQDAYGWEKLISERLFLHYGEEHRMQIRIARLHNIYGPEGTWQGGREKSPAALCRKIAEAKLRGTHDIEIWGDGKQTRSYCYIADCIEGIGRLMESTYGQPLNIGQDHMISINDLAHLIAQIAGINITPQYIPGPEGVRGRNSDNATMKNVLHWKPSITLEDGMRKTYTWIEKQVRDRATMCLHIPAA